MSIYVLYISRESVPMWLKARNVSSLRLTVRDILHSLQLLKYTFEEHTPASFGKLCSASISKRKILYLRSSPSVIVFSPTFCCNSTIPLIASSSASVSSSFVHFPCSYWRRFSYNVEGRNNEPTCSARKGGLRCRAVVKGISRLNQMLRQGTGSTIIKSYPNTGLRVQ